MSHNNRFIFEPLTASEERRLAEIYINVILPWPIASEQAKCAWYVLIRGINPQREIQVKASTVAAIIGAADSASGRRTLISLTDSRLATLIDRDKKLGNWHMTMVDPLVDAIAQCKLGDPQFMLAFKLDDLERLLVPDRAPPVPDTPLTLPIRSAPIPQPAQPRTFGPGMVPARQASGPQRVPVNRLGGHAGTTADASLGSQMQKLVDGWCSDASLARRTQELTDWIMHKINDPNTQPQNIMLLAEAVVEGRVKRSEFLQVLYDADRTTIHTSRGAYIMKGFLRVLQQSGVERWTKRKPTMGR